jgi:hypothetical protein
MSIADTVADLDAILLAAEGQTVEVRPCGSETAPGIALLAILDTPQQMLDIGDGDRRIEDRATILANRTTVAAAFATLLGSSRNWRRDDVVVITAGIYTGTWFILDVVDDAGGGTTATAIRRACHEAAARNRRRERT